MLTQRRKKDPKMHNLSTLSRKPENVWVTQEPKSADRHTDTHTDKSRKATFGTVFWYFPHLFLHFHRSKTASSRVKIGQKCGTLFWALPPTLGWLFRAPFRCPRSLGVEDAGAFVPLQPDLNRIRALRSLCEDRQGITCIRQGGQKWKLQ